MIKLTGALLSFVLMVQTATAQVAIVPGDRFRSWTVDNVSLEQFEHYFVVKERRSAVEDEEEDEFRLDIDSFIVDALLQLGLNANSGEADEMPSETQVRVTYESFYRKSKRTSGVTDLILFFRDARTNAVIALAEMEKVQDWPGPDMIAAAVHYLVDRSVALVESPYSASELTKAYEAETTDPEGALPEFSARGEIRIVNAQPSVRWPIIYPMRFLAKKEYVDYHQLLEVAKEALEQQIRDAGGVIVTEGGDKTITLRVTDLANIAIIQTFLNFTLETGDGYFQGYQAYGKHWNYRKSIDAAVADVTVQVLNDPNVISYLER
jgi:hypothetical protein